jgi:hypothetical protein
MKNLYKFIIVLVIASALIIEEVNAHTLSSNTFT